MTNPTQADRLAELEELAREALNDAESLGHPLCGATKRREACESRAALFEVIASLAKQQATPSDEFVAAYQAIIEIARNHGATQREIEAAQYTALASKRTEQQAREGDYPEEGVYGPLNNVPPSQVPAAQSGWREPSLEQVEMLAKAMQKTDGLLWLGYRKDADGEYTIPQVSPSTYKLILGCLKEFSQQEPTVAQAPGLHPNHLPDLRYVLQVLERAIPLLKRDTLRGDAEAAVVGMRYIIKRTEGATPSQVIDKVDAELVRAVVRSVQPDLAGSSKAWRELANDCSYWLEARAAIASTGKGQKT